LHGRAVAHVSLSSVLEVGPAKAFTRKANCETVLADFMKRATAIRDDGGTLRSIHREIAAVREEYRGLRTAKDRLQEMTAAGLLKFVKRVDARSIKVICAVLAKGDMAKAARAAGLKYSTMRDLIAGWRRRGKDYAILADLVRWRKQMRFRGTVRLDETMLEGKTPDTDYAGLLGDVLEGLLEMTEENWEEKCETLADLLRPQVER